MRGFPHAAPNAFWAAEIAQLVEHAPEKRGVASSILALGTRSKPRVLNGAREASQFSENL
jgi:hypothetical protein